MADRPSSLADDDEGQQENHDDKISSPKSVIPTTPWQHYVHWFVTDVLLYILILNLSSEIVDTIRIDKFSISLVVALMLKFVLDIIQLLEHKIQHLFCHQLNRRIIGAFLMWLVIFSSKFLILWMDDVIFGRHVDLGGFLQILILSFVLLVSVKLSRFLYEKLGDWEKSRWHESEDDIVKERIEIHDVEEEGDKE